MTAAHRTLVSVHSGHWTAVAVQPGDAHDTCSGIGGLDRAVTYRPATPVREVMRKLVECHLPRCGGEGTV